MVGVACCLLLCGTHTHRYSPPSFCVLPPGRLGVCFRALVDMPPSAGGGLGGASSEASSQQLSDAGFALMPPSARDDNFRVVLIGINAV